MLRRSFSIVLLLIFLACPGGAFGRNLTYRFPKDQVAAAYLYNFALFSQWPETAFEDAAGFVIATFDPAFADLAAKSLNGRLIGARQVEVRLIHTIEECAAAQIVLLTEKELAQWDDIRTLLSTQPVLTVGTAADFALSGGVIELFIVDHRLRFIINLDTARQTGVVISSEVLSLAERVVDGGQAENIE